MARQQYLITYDICDDKRRNSVFQALIANGDHVQYSVFLCALSPMELAALRATLSALIHARDDQILIVNLGPAPAAPAPLFDCLGKRYHPTTRVRVI